MVTGSCLKKIFSIVIVEAIFLMIKLESGERVTSERSKVTGMAFSRDIDPDSLYFKPFFCYNQKILSLE